MIKLAVDNSSPTIEAKSFKNKNGSRWFFDPDIKELFGLDHKTKWPPQGMTAREIQGITAWVNPLAPTEGILKRQPFKIRAMCMCTACGKVVAIGRLNQHNKVHK